ncbi:hypothetical protein CRE_14493 [Caenorhabditis remanei]|uniref:F-box domain-containing protein n=1 Tax=Caenorhabditis remanei TaxID=31234 RepID=E3M976_CAERE|nr:hypothetical protein CRE_14493 [Caenorhabditis remanei]
MWFDRNFENWNFLPNEIKLLCINRLDFKSRLSLGATAHNERSLVNNASERIYINSFSIRDRSDSRDLEIRFRERGNPEQIKIFREDQIVLKAIPLLSYLFNNGYIHSFGLYLNKNQESIRILTRLTGESPFYIRGVRGQLHLEHFPFFARCAANSMKGMTLRYEKLEMFPVDRFLALPAVNSIEFWRIDVSFSRDLGVAIIRKWIEKDVKIGSTHKISSCGGKPMDDFIAEFGQELILDRTDTILRIKTRNPSKHLILKTYNHSDGCVFKMVPSDFKPSDYSKIPNRDHTLLNNFSRV